MKIMIEEQHVQTLRKKKNQEFMHKISKNSRTWLKGQISEFFGVEKGAMF